MKYIAAVTLLLASFRASAVDAGTYVEMLSEHPGGLAALPEKELGEIYPYFQGIADVLSVVRDSKSGKITLSLADRQPIEICAPKGVPINARGLMVMADEELTIGLDRLKGLGDAWRRTPVAMLAIARFRDTFRCAP